MHTSARLTVLSAALLLAVCLGSCSGGTASTGSTGAPSSAAATPTADGETTLGATTSPGPALTSVQDIRSGDCFVPAPVASSQPSAGPDSSAEGSAAATADEDTTQSSQVDLVSIVECSQPHRFQVLDVTEMSGESLPEPDALYQQAQASCESVAAPYLSDQTGQATYRAQFLAPTADSWRAGDRSLVCLLTSADSTELTGPATR
ncbi:septum formation family protein [Actinomyces faecalis]|uniref:septum formation family protein n=1 Tax=Actinomyces faecalis TaxID=2722820 RepID=UPI0015576083|nr:septum formation family protein [Actinomyces faecalis]